MPCHGRGTRAAPRDPLARDLPELRPVGASAGLHVLAWLPSDLDEARVVAAALAAGIGISGVTPRRLAPGSGGLIFGYGGIAEGKIEEGVRHLARVIEAI